MMRIACRGKVVGKTVVLEEGTELPEGAIVEVCWVQPSGSTASAEERQRALHRLVSLNLPVGDWETMEDEIVRGAVEP